MKIMTHVRFYEGFYCGKPCDFIGNKCNNAGLNKVINRTLLLYD